MSSVLEKIDHELRDNEIAHCRKEAKKIQKSVELIKHYLKNAIIHANIESNDNIANESMALLYTIVIEDINTVLEVQFGSKPINSTYNSRIDASPDETADKVVSSSIAFFTDYYQQHPDLTEVKAAGVYVDGLTLGVDKGFSEVRNILDELKVLEGDIERNIDATYDFIQVGLQAFEYGFVKNAKYKK